MSEARRLTQWEEHLAAQARTEAALRAVLATQAGTWRTAAELATLMRSGGTPVDEQRVRQALAALEVAGLVESRAVGPRGNRKWWRLRAAGV